MNRRNRVAFFNILSTVLLRGISIFTAPLFTRLLGTSGYGVTQIYNTWVAVIAIVFTLQTQGTLVNARVEYPEGDQLRYQSSAMSLSTLVYLIFSALVLCFIGPISGALKLSWFLIVLMLIQGFGTFCVNFLNTKFVYEFKAGRNMVMSLVVTLTTLILSIVLILLLPKQINYLGRISAIAVTYGVLGIPVCIWILAKGKTFYNKEYWKFCVVLAIPAVFYNLSDLILGQSDKVMLQQMMDEATVGCYGAALNFGGIMFTLFTALNNSWCPFFFEDMKQGNRENLREKAGNFLELFTVLSVGFVLLASEVYRYVYVSRDFWGSTMLIPIFVSSYYTNFLCTFPVNFEYYHKKTKVVSIITIVSSLINVGLNYLLILRIGMAGAAVATLISHSLQLTLHYLYVRFALGGKEYPFPLKMWGGYAAVFAAVAVASVAALWCASERDGEPLDAERLREALASFEGVKRRFEFYVNTPRQVYMDDYAHHPRELAAAITSVKKMFPGRRLTALFQPHLYTRTRDFYREFAEALSHADRVVLLPIYPAREEPIPGVESEMIGRLLTVPWTICDRAELAEKVAAMDTDVVVSFGAGNIDACCGALAEKLREKA